MKTACPNPNAYAATCPTRLVLDRVADKWAVLILGLLADEPVRFNGLRRLIEGISQKMLSQTLKSLERGRPGQPQGDPPPCRSRSSIRSRLWGGHCPRRWIVYGYGQKPHIDKVLKAQKQYDAGVQRRAA